MKHKSFSIEVPVNESKDARPFLYKFDKELENHGYRTTAGKVLSDANTPLPENSFMRNFVTSRTMISDKAYLTFETSQLLQGEKGQVYHLAGIKGNISVCEEKDIKEFEQIIKSVFNIENLKLDEV